MVKLGASNHTDSGGWLNSPVTRRAVLRSGAALAAAGTVGGLFFRENKALAANYGDPVLVETDSKVEVLYSVCQGCHGRCGIKCRVVDGVLEKIDGSPYHPNNLEQHSPFNTDPNAAKLVPASLCAKGLGGIQSLYDPYRLKEPLKRVGPRGAGQWETISWDQAFQEIGAKLLQYRDLSSLIDPAAPELGKKVNQIVFSGGRNQQSAFTDTFWKKVIGTVNSKHDHTSICEVSHHIAHELCTGWGDAAPFLTSGFKNHTKPDLPNTQFVLWFGSDPCSANFSFVPIARKVIEMVERGGKLYVVDPRCNVAASKGTWVPIKTGVDAALALAIGRYIVDNNLYNTAFLQRPHSAAANPTGELNVTDATLLVKIVSGRPAAFLRANEAGILGGANTEFVVWATGAAAKFNAVDAADLLPGSVVVNGHTCKTVFQLYAERVREKTLAEYSAICGVDVATIQTLATELAAAGRHGSVTMYRGAVQHTNGTYTGLAILALNLLVGNFNWKGGLAFGGPGWSTTYSGSPYGDPNTVPGAATESGVQLTRVKSKYETSTEFGVRGYPARRPWFPLAGHYNFQEIIPSIEDEYPYPVKALFLYWNGTPYSTPGARATFERVLSNKVGEEYKVPLVVVVDIAMSETAEWADYVLPDTTYFERWTVVGLTPTIITKSSPVRQPVVGTVDAGMNYTGVLPNTKTLEDMLMGIGRSMGLSVPWSNAWDYWGKLIGNMAAESAGPGLDYVLSRGGRFEDYTMAYDGEKLRHRFSGRLHFFSEKLATKHDSMTGQWFDGMGKHEAIADVMGNPIAVGDTNYPLQLVTYKTAWHTQSHTIRYPWLVSVQQGNFVEMNATDAEARGIRTGDRVRLISPDSSTEGLEGIAKVTQTVCPGVVAVSHHFGHWGMSSRAHKVNGADTSHDASRGVGIQSNLIMRLDPYLGNVTLQDKVGGSASFYDTQVQVTRI